MLGQILTLGALALGVANANALEYRWTYPNCDTDNCYNELTDSRFIAEAESFCPEFLSGTTTAASAIPTDFGNCGGDVAAVSSACSCITYTMTYTSSASSTAPTTSATSTLSTSSIPSSTASSSAPSTTETSSGPVITGTPPPGSTYYSTSTTPSSTVSTTSLPGGSFTSSSPSSSITLWSTSTLYTTTVSTIYSCASEVTSCPYRLTTQTISLTTTVCPVTTIPVVTTPVYSTETFYSTAVSTIYSCAPEVTSCPYESATASTTYTTVVPCSSSVYTTYATSLPAGETLTSSPAGVLTSILPPQSTFAPNGTITTSPITKPSSTETVVPASGADRLVGGFAAAAAGLLAAVFFL